MKKKKKIIMGIGVVAIIAIIVAAIIIFVKNKREKDKDDVVYVESIEILTGYGFYGTNRYMGIVETQETKGVEKAQDRTVKEVFVNEGDVVKEGDKLFEYDTEEMTLKLKQLELELSSIYSSISTTNEQIAALKEERDAVEEEYKIEYTSQIQSLQAQVNQENYNASAKQLEIDRQKAAIENAIVYSPMDGIIKEINNNENGESDPYYDSNYGYGSEQSNAFITIMDVGEYRVKVTLNEMEIYNFVEGDRVILRSRVDDNMIWHGEVTLVDTEHPEENNNDYYYMGDTSSSLTKYPMYISLDSSENIMLGQHVYVEYDFGQGEVKDGLWLDEYYIVFDGDKPYVWAENNKKLEKRYIELGNYDEEMCQYEVISGLTMEDYIAFPEDRLKEGMKTTHNIGDVAIEEDMGMEEGMEIYDGEEMYDDMEIYDGEEMYDDMEIYDGEEMYDDVDTQEEIGEPFGSKTYISNPLCLGVVCTEEA